MNTADTILGWSILIGITLLFIWGIIHVLMKRHRTTKRILQEWKRPQKEPKLIEKHVHILSKSFSSEIIGVKFPKHRDIYQLTVRTDDGDIKTYTVDKEVYHTIKEHTHGTLAFVGDRVYGYCKD